MASGAKDPRELAGGNAVAEWAERGLGGERGALSLGLYNHMTSRCWGTRMGPGEEPGGPLEPPLPTLGKSGILFPTLDGWLRRREENCVISNGCIFYSYYLRQAWYVSFNRCPIHTSSCFPQQ